MGLYSKVVFGRDRLPSSCLIYAGVYAPQRKEWVRTQFDKWERVKGYWVRYTFARKQDKEFLIVFNVYGSQLLLEILHLIKDGQGKKAFFIGSVGGKNLPVGTVILPTEIIDKTGLISVDEPGKEKVRPEAASLARTRSILESLHIEWTEGTLASVPCVLHNIKQVKDFVDNQETIIGINMELSNFTHFSQKLGLDGGSLVYVSDNKEYSVISSSRTVQEARRKSLKIITQAAVSFL